MQASDNTSDFDEETESALCRTRSALERDYISDALERLGIFMSPAEKQRLMDIGSAREVHTYLRANSDSFESRVRLSRTVTLGIAAFFTALTIIFALVSAFADDNSTQRATGILASLFTWVPLAALGIEVYMLVNGGARVLLPEYDGYLRSLETFEDLRVAAERHVRVDRCSKCAFGRGREDYLRIDAEEVDGVGGEAEATPLVIVN